MNKAIFKNFDPYWAFKDSFESRLFVDHLTSAKGSFMGFDLESFLMDKGVHYGVSGPVSSSCKKLVDYSTEYISERIIYNMLVYTGREIEDKPYLSAFDIVSQSAFDLLYLLYHHAKHRAEEHTSRKLFIARNLINSAARMIRDGNVSFAALLGSTSKISSVYEENFIKESVNTSTTAFISDCYKVVFIDQTQCAQLMNHYVQSSCSELGGILPLVKHTYGIDVPVESVRSNSAARGYFYDHYRDYLILEDVLLNL